MKLIFKSFAALLFVVSANQSFATANEKPEYLYDAEGRVTKVIYPNGEVTKYAYDSSGKVVEEKTCPSESAAILTMPRSTPRNSAGLPSGGSSISQV